MASPILVHLFMALASFLTFNLSWMTLFSPGYGPKQLVVLAVTPLPGSDGPGIWLGLFTVCSRPNAFDPNNERCSRHLGVNHKYDVSILPSEAPLFTLREPPVQLRVLALINFILSTLYSVLTFVMLVTSLIRCLLGLAPTPQQRKLKRFSATIALILSIVGPITFSIIWVHFEKACRDFNVIIARNGSPNPELVASLGKTFNSAYAGYIVIAVIPLALVFIELREGHPWQEFNEKQPG